MSTLVECSHLSKRFGAKEALSDLSFTLEKGRIIGLLGPNGSGKTTLLKTMNGLLVPTAGEIRINGAQPGIETKKVISYLPERTYLNDWMKACDIIDFFEDFYTDFNREKAYDMLDRLHVNPKDPLKSMSKGTREKVQLVLVMSREAELYCLDEPIGGVDPASRDYILDTILTNYSSDASLLISTHLIADIEKYLDDVIFLKDGSIYLSGSAEELRMQHNCSIDALFREVFRC